ncbi:3-oxoacyl-ACP synthase III family protein [Epilithonimonas mollis]|uniref:3-oxoacyl-[acyl-carrier-protein] synthase-3 n=1 Tax=Epilithonimonas mollis TaxID=216903 RepID=A0A1M6R7F2_9FLAO|nr:ketoacyl-ACP synthase III [Epilithonimonas mollis]SHK28373.1 3-oxoacyl-[acyl-carrier-protein] synthase-3 [Epilithonimonas mollis]
MINIAAIEYYLPRNILTNDDIAKEFPEWSAEKIKAKIGVESRHIAEQDETALDMAYKACKKLFRNYDKNKIDFILFCTQSPDYFLPTTACILQDKLGLSKSVGALDFNLGCSGFVYGLTLAKGLIATGIAQNILLVTSETYSKFLDKEDKSNRTIFGDGAAVTIVEKDSAKSDFQFSVGTDGSGFSNLIVENGASRNNAEKPVLYMKGPKIFTFAVENIPTLINDTLEKNRLRMDDIDLFVFHQASSYMLNYLKDLCNIPDEKFFMEMKDIGNTVSASIPIALKLAQDKSIIQKGNKVMVVGFGVGYSWGAGVLEF